MPPPPIAFDRWSASSNGTITASCPAGFTCTDNVSSEDMLQRILVDNSNGQTFVQVLLASGAVNDTGRLLYESFTNANDGTPSGISAKMIINQNSIEYIDYSVLLNLGWANTAGAPAIDFSQTIKNTYNGNVQLDYTFDYQQNQNSRGVATGYKYGIRENLKNSASINGSGNNDNWTFVLRRVGGDFAGSGSASVSSGGMMGGGGGMNAANTPTANANTQAPAANTVPATNTISGDVPAPGFTMPPDGYGLNSPVGFPEDTIIGPGTSNDPPMVGTLPGSRFNISDNTTIGESYINVSTRSGAGGGVISNGTANGDAIPAGPVDVPTGSTRGMGMGGGPSGGTVSWSTGNEVQVIWIGESCSSCVIAGMGGMGNSSGDFSYQSYTNITTGATAAGRSIRSTAPLNWQTTPFGPQPRM